MSLSQRLPRLAIGCAMGALAAMSAPAGADDEGVAAEMRRLNERIEALQEQLDALKQRQQRLMQRAEGERDDRPAERPTVATAPQAPAEQEPARKEAADKEQKVTVDVGGRIMVDAAIYDDDGVELGSGSEIRRARLFAKGEIGPDFKYKAQYGFAGNEVDIKDAYISYTGLPFDLTLGNFKEPVSLEEQTSSKYITFTERALPNALSPGRNLGLAASGHGERWQAKAGVFGMGVDNDTGVDEGYGISGRASFNPVLKGERLVHVGGWARYREPSDDNTARFRQRPESHVTDVRLVDTGTLEGVDNLAGFGGELAGVMGSWSLQAEYLGTKINRFGGLDDPYVDGFYGYASWFATGEQRAYDPADGAFGRVHPHNPVGSGGAGALELALRYSQLDLSDGLVDGGNEENLAFGVNWYLTSHIRLMANYVEVLSLDGGPLTGTEPASFQFRGQIDF